MEAWSYCLLTYRKKYSYLFSIFTDTKSKFLAKQWGLDSYKYSIKAQSYCPVNSRFAPIRTKIGYTE